LKQFRLAGNPASRKQDATWMRQFDAAVLQELESEKPANGFEHQLPHWYSQVGVGVTVVVTVHDDVVGVGVGADVVELEEYPSGGTYPHGCED
jgi:hypothetical protein